MNREKAIRTAFYSVLNSIIYPAGSGIRIPISDGKAISKDKIYTLIESQTAQDSSDMRNKRWNASITITVIHKQKDSYTRDIVDDIGEEIESTILPGNAALNGLPEVPGWKITNVYLGNIDYADFQINENETVCIKFLTFNFIINKI